MDFNFEYEYEKIKFVLLVGKILFIMGQMIEDIDDYMFSFLDKLIFGGWFVYWGVLEFRGIISIFINENGSFYNY